MAKKENDMATQQTDLVVKQNDSLVTSEVSGELATAMQAGMTGFENVKSDDVAIPFIKILQALSPEIKKGPDKIEGAEEGDLYNTVTGEVYKGEVQIISCAFQKAYVEWTPRSSGGGFVKQHFDSSILTQTKKGGQNMRDDVLPNGNIIVTTAYHFCLLVKEDGSTQRVVMPFSSTQLKKSRKWLGQMQAIRITTANGSITPPMFSHIWEVSTVIEQKDTNTWFGYSIDSPTIIKTAPLFKEAMDFYKAVTAGSVKAAEPVDEDLAVSSGKDSNDISDVEQHF